MSATAYRFKFNISSRCNNELASFYSDIWEFPSDAITDIVETETKLYDTSNLSGDHMTTDYNQFDVMITIPNDACKYVVDTDALGDYDIENSVTRIEEITFNFTYMDANDAMTSEVGIYYEEEEEDVTQSEITITDSVLVNKLNIRSTVGKGILSLLDTYNVTLSLDQFGITGENSIVYNLSLIHI